MISIRLICRNEASFKPSRSELDQLSYHFHADTLWSALVNIFANVYAQAETDAFIAASQKGLVSMSSVFPCLERPDGSMVYLFPKPIGLGMDDPDHLKEWKAVRWVSKRVIEEGKPDLANRLGTGILLSREEFPAYGKHSNHPEDPEQRIDLGYREQPKLGGYQPLGLEKVRFFRFTDLPKVRKHSRSKEDNLYYQSQMQLLHARVLGEIWKPHFYFLVQFSPDLEKELQEKIMAIIRLIPDTGLGGERSTGLGLFEGVDEEVWSSTNPKGELKMTLSAVCLSNEAEYSSFLAYDTLIRGGGVVAKAADQGWHRHRLRMIREGSIFQGEVRGRIADVSPPNRKLPHTIWRYGKCFSLAIHSDLNAFSHSSSSRSTHNSNSSSSSISLSP